MLTQLQNASSPGSRPVRLLGRCEVTLKETCGVVFVREVLNTPRMRTLQYDSLLWFVCVSGFFVFG